MMKNFWLCAGWQRSATLDRTRPSASTHGTSLPFASTIVHGYQVLIALPLPYGGYE